MSKRITNEALLRKLESSKLEGVSVQEMHAQLLAEGTSISIHWLRKVWAVLPKRPSLASRKVEAMLKARLTQAAATALASAPAQAAPLPIFPSAKAPEIRTQAPAKPVATPAPLAAHITKATVSADTGHFKKLTQEAALAELEALLKEKLGAEFAFSKYDAPETKTLFGSFSRIAVLRSKIDKYTSFKDVQSWIAEELDDCPAIFKRNLGPGLWPGVLDWLNAALNKPF